jgi:hypothetical protein
LFVRSLYHLLKSVHAYKTAQVSEHKSSTSSTDSTPVFAWDWAEYKRRWPQAVRNSHPVNLLCRRADPIPLHRFRSTLASS